MINGFEIEEKLPSYNEYINANRRGWQAGATFKKKVQRIISFYALQAERKGQLRPIKHPCIVQFFWNEPNHRRDVDNVQSAQKFILDALQEIKILPDDSPKWVQQTEHEVRYNKEHPAVLVVIQEQEDAL